MIGKASAVWQFILTPLPVPPPQGGREPEESTLRSSSNGVGARNMRLACARGHSDDEGACHSVPSPLWGRDREGVLQARKKDTRAQRVTASAWPSPPRPTTAWPRRRA